MHYYNFTHYGEMKYFYLILIVITKISKEKKALSPFFLFCQIQCDSIVHVCQSRQLGHIIKHEKEDRELYQVMGKLFPKNNKIWNFSTSDFSNFSPMLERRFFFFSFKPLSWYYDEGAFGMLTLLFTTPTTWCATFILVIIYI